MNNTKKKWTAILPVKITCFVLALVQPFVFLNRLNTIFMTNYHIRVSLDVIFSNYSVAHDAVYTWAREAYIRDFIIMASSAAVFIALFVILLLGAGRRRGADGIHFAIIDRPFLDVSLAAVLFLVRLTVYAFEHLFYAIWAAQYIAAMNLMIAASVISFGIPTLLWVLSLAKRMKAGSFWKHTLIWFLPSKVIGFAVRTAKSLWCGFPLMLKSGLTICASAFLLLITGAVGAASRELGAALIATLICTAAVAFFLLRYALRIHNLEEGARKASDGVYDKPIEAGGGELGSIAGSINNISAGINTAVEERLKSERLKTELITNVSHDIRTPLTSIITYADLLRNEGLDFEKAPEYLDVLIQKSQRLKTLTDELFEAAKAATGNIDVNITELDCVSLINQVLGELEGSLNASGLDLRVNLPEKLAAKADGKLMWRILENLLSNVFKYSLPGSRAYLDAYYDKPSACIVLKNISAAELNIDPAELTERFKRGDDSRSDGGSGLGLSIVQSFVAAQGGKLGISIDGDLFKATVSLPSA